MSEKVLVCILGQTRAHELTWPGFRRYVLDELGADLALSIGVDNGYDRSNPFYQHAKFHWTVPEYEDYGEAFDEICSEIGSNQDWRVLLRHRGNWMGGVRPVHGSGGILLYYRWVMMRNLQKENLLNTYDRFILTRSDYFYWSPHPPLDILNPEYIWVPFGDDCEGITDRHLVVSPRDLQISVDFVTEILKTPEQLDRELLRLSNWNLERFLYLQFLRRGLLTKVRRYPHVMVAVRLPQEVTKSGTNGEFDPDEGMVIKFPNELKSAQTFREILTDKEAWRKFKADGGFERLEELAPQPFRKFEARASAAKWRVRQILDRIGVI